MKFEKGKAISVLERTPNVLNTLLRDLSSEWTHQNEGEGTWSTYDIIGHLIQGEQTDWIPRAEIILSNNPNKGFEPFDRFAQVENSKGKSFDELLNEFEQLRTENIKKLAAMNLSPQNLSLEGIHPEFGKITLRQLLTTWVAHDLGHIAQISRVMAKQYKAEAGPWVRYLKVLQD